MSFAEWLQEELNKRGWNQTEFARRSGIPRGHISRLLNGTRQAGPDPCIAIALALGLPREEVFRVRGWLLDGSEKKAEVKLSAEAYEVASKIDQLPLEARHVALRVTNATADALREQAIGYGRAGMPVR